MGKLALTSAKPPATMREALATAHPLHQMFGQTLESLGGTEFLTAWARDNPTDFIKILMALAPPTPPQVPRQPSGPAAAGPGLHLHLHQGLAPGALDGVVIEQS